MNLIDTNGIDYILKNHHTTREEYFVTPDVKSESEVTELIHGRRMPANLRDLSEHRLFDANSYLQHYKSMLNKHSDRSFFNMTGFGDISILAAIKTIREKSAIENTGSLFNFPESITVYTMDSGLTLKIHKEFNGEVLVKNPRDLA